MAVRGFSLPQKLVERFHAVVPTYRIVLRGGLEYYFAGAAAGASSSSAASSTSSAEPGTMS
jgi:hypothetical protein